MLAKSNPSHNSDTDSQQQQELKLHKEAEDEDSPEFPAIIYLSTMDNLVKDIKSYLIYSGAVAGVVVRNSEGVNIITDPKQAPREALVKIVNKKGKDYFSLTSM